EERKKLPADAVTRLQTLALWLPADGRILWQLGELANAFGDVRNAAAILEGCVSEFGMNDPVLRQHRVTLRQAADEEAKQNPATRTDAQAAHSAHAVDGGLRMRSTRPLVRRTDQNRLPDIKPNGLNMLPWPVLAETTIGRPFQPTFADHVKKLNGKRVYITGFIQPIGDDLEMSQFMLIEYPVGCWFCEVPEPTGIILVELEQNRTVKLTRDLVKIEGVL